MASISFGVNSVTPGFNDTVLTVGELSSGYQDTANDLLA